MTASMIRTTLALLSALTVCPMAAGAAAAHEEGVLTLASPTVAAGSKLSLQGEHFSAGSYTLFLRGALREYDVGSVEVGGDGTFALDLAVPPAVEPGAYRLVAIADDGDEAAAADVEVLAAPQGAPAREADAALTRPTPSAEELDIRREWSGAEWFFVGVLFGGAVVGGAALLRQ